VKINHDIGKGGGQTPSKPFKDVKLLIGIPTRTNTCFIDFATSLAVTMSTIVQNGGTVGVRKSQNDCFVEVARNHLVNFFMQTDYTHLMMIDDDMSWNPMSIEKMILADKEFISGTGPMKGDDIKFAFNSDDAKEHPDGLWELKSVGAAFSLFKRSVFEKMKAAYPEMYSDFYKGYGFFRMEVNKEHLITEDYSFCLKWSAIGGKCWCFPDIDFGHLGHKVYEGNFYKKLKGIAA
jgi:hypothetical protein